VSGFAPFVDLARSFSYHSFTPCQTILQPGKTWYMVSPSIMEALKSPFATVEDWDLLGALQPHVVLFAAVAANQPVTVGVGRGKMT
jgi:hypothetical protein